MPIFHGPKSSRDEEANAGRRSRSSDRSPDDRSGSLSEDANERTRLLNRPSHEYLSPDDPSVGDFLVLWTLLTFSGHSL